MQILLTRDELRKTVVLLGKQQGYRYRYELAAFLGCNLRALSPRGQGKRMPSYETMLRWCRRLGHEIVFDLKPVTKEASNGHQRHQATQPVDPDVGSDRPGAHRQAG